MQKTIVVAAALERQRPSTRVEGSQCPRPLNKVEQLYSIHLKMPRDKIALSTQFSSIVWLLDGPS